MPPRLFLSPPHMGGEELDLIRAAFASNYIAPVGPMVDAFEQEFARYTGIPHCLALSSGTAAMHLALREVGVGPGDEVLASSLTFIGSVSPVTFLQADLVFIDSDRQSWNMDPDLLAQELAQRARRGTLPKAVIPTDLYGQCADLNRIQALCDPYGIPVISDAAEAMGARYQKVYAATPHPPLPMNRTSSSALWAPSPPLGEKDGMRGRLSGSRAQCAIPVRGGLSPTEAERDQKSAISAQRSEVTSPRPSPQSGEGVALNAEGRGQKSGESLDLQPSTRNGLVHAGVGAKAAVYSFNGNKIITTSGGGMLASEDEGLIEHARKLSQQARDPAPHYEHSEIGYNYRMSNIAAAIGRGQLRVLNQRVERKREIFRKYKQLLGELPGLEFMPEAPYCRSNRWLTVVLLDERPFGASPEKVRLALEAENIESRPGWKPMHLQPVFKGYPYRGNGVSDDIFRRALCLPSGTAMTDSDLERVCQIIRRCRR